MGNTQKLIEEYWECEVTSTQFKKYGEFFYMFRNSLEKKLALHGILTFDDYIKHVSEFYNLDNLEKLTYRGKHSKITYTLEDIERLIFEPRYKEFRKKYKNTNKYKQLNKLHIELNNPKRKNDKILMEQCIHAEHNSGYIIGVDIKKLRRNFEKLMKDKNFNIYVRSAFESKIKNKKYNYIFIDFNNIHHLNSTLGYETVNKKFKNIFNNFDFREDDIVARWFSGDEIIIATNGDAKTMLKRFTKHVGNHDMKFKYVIFNNVKTYKELCNKIDSVKWRCD